MRKIIILLILTLLLPYRASAFPAGPLRLKGKVVEAKNDDPVVGAVIKLDDNYLWSVSDQDGGFSLGNVQPGRYILSVSCLGYVDSSQEIILGKDISDLTIRLNVNSLALQEVVVTAEKSKDNINTTQKIGRNALDHLQMSGMSDIGALLPGGKTINPDLTSEKTLSLRAGGSTAGNAAFGTAVEIDGVRMGGNASLTGIGGVGTRGVSVENIESVEVITGVPSAEYGDLNSGMIRVITRKGRTPLNVTFSVNPRTYEASASKGVDLGGKAGVLNLSGEYARATQKLTSPYTSYTRRGFTIDYSNTFRKVLRLEAGLTGNIGGMNSKDDPDLFSEEFTKERDNILTPRFKLVWLLNKEWITNVRLEGSLYYHDQRQQVHAYNSYASSQPAVHSEKEGYFVADALPLTFYSDQVIDSRELDFSLGLHYNWLHHWGSVKSTLKAGATWKADGNVGEGEYYEDPSLAANGYRPRPYADYPYMHNAAAYAEDNLIIPVGKTSLNLSAGLRLENVFIKGTDYENLRTLSPRLNAKWTFNDALSVRGGLGVTQKLPSFYILFPKQEYRDIQTFSYSFGSSGDARYIFYTQPYTMTFNPELKWQSNTNAEIGIDLSVKDFKVSLVGFSNVTRNPYEYTNVYTPFSYNIVALPSGFKVESNSQTVIDSQTGLAWFRNSPEDFWVQTEAASGNKSFTASRKQSNGADVKRYGVELTTDFPEINPIRTQLRLDASYGYTKYVDDIENSYYNNGWFQNDKPYQYVGIYAGGFSVVNGKKTCNVDANLTAITHIPSARLVVTCRLEATFLRTSQSLSEHDGKTYAFTVGEVTTTPTGGDIYDGKSYTAVMPVAYMDLGGNIHEFTEADLNNPELSNLIVRSANIYTFAKDGYDPYFSANLSVTKEIGDHVSLSFFANNFTNSRRYVKSWATGVGAIFTPAFYYGLTCRIKL